MQQLDSGVWVRIGQYSKLRLYSVDKNAWYSSEAKALEVYANKQAIAAKQVQS